MWDEKRRSQSVLKKKKEKSKKSSQEEDMAVEKIVRTMRGRLVKKKRTLWICKQKTVIK